MPTDHRATLASIKRFDQLIALPHVVEDLGPEDEETAVDPEVGILAGANSLDLSVRLHVDEMQTE